MNWLSLLTRLKSRTRSRPARPSAPRRPSFVKPVCEELEPRIVPASTITAAFGAGYGGGPEVTVRFDDGSRFSFFAFAPNFAGGVSVALGRVNGSAVPDVVVGAGRSGGPEVEVFDGQQLLAGNVVTTAAFFAFDQNLRDGVSVATGHINGTANDDVVVANGQGGPPLVSVFDGAKLAHGQAVATATFDAFPAGFLGGATLAVGHVNGSSHADVVVGAGPGGGPQVRVFDGAQLALGHVVSTAGFFAFPLGFTGGVVVATGRVNGTGFSDVVVGAGPGGGPEVVVYDGQQLARGNAIMTAAFFAFPVGFSGGVTLAVGNVNNTGHADVVVGAGPGGGPEVVVVDGAHLAQGQTEVTAAFFAFPLGFQGGVQVFLGHQPGAATDFIYVAAGPGGGPEVVVYDPIYFPYGDYNPYDAFFAFDPYFVGGVDFGFDFIDYGGCGCAYGPQIGGTTAGPQPTGGFGGTGGGFSGGGFTGGGSGGGGTGGFSGGSGGSGGGSLRAAAVGGVGGKGQGGGLYAPVGMLSVGSHHGGKHAAAGGAGAHPKAAPSHPKGSHALTAAQLLGATNEAIAWWDAAGVNPAEDLLLRDTQILFGNLNGDSLGHTGGGVIQLSATADGYGWFVDPLSAGADAGHMDLATVIAHEMGHVLGLEHSAASGDLMDPFLPPGVRRTPTTADLNALFSGG